MYHYGDARRLAWCTVDSPAVANQFSFIALFNNSTGAQLICVHDVVTNTEISNTPSYVVVDQVQPSGTLVNPIPAFTAETTPVGIGFVGSAVARPAKSFNYTLQGAPFGNPRPYPWLVLQVGWRLSFWYSAIDTEIAASFFYEWRWPWEFPAITDSPTGG